MEVCRLRTSKKINVFHATFKAANSAMNPINVKSVMHKDNKHILLHKTSEVVFFAASLAVVGANSQISVYLVSIIKLTANLGLRTLIKVHVFHAISMVANDAK